MASSRAGQLPVMAAGQVELFRGSIIITCNPAIIRASAQPAATGCSKSAQVSSMISKIHPIPAFTDNYIWAIHHAESAAVAVVDPGDAAPVMDYLQQHDGVLSHVLITHHHHDHTGGLKALIAACNPLVFGPQPSRINGITEFLHEGDSLELFDTAFTVLEVPGHTLDHIAYYSDQADPPLLFCGDTLFAAGCGRLFEGTPAMMLNSLDKLAKLPPATAVYCTHEYTLANLQFALAAESNNTVLQTRVVTEQAKRRHGLPTLPSSIAMELATNPFLRCDQQRVIQRVAAATGTIATDTLAVFAALRGWKDHFQA